MSDMDLGLNGRVCVVTGASSGIGLAVADMLCQEGASVLMIARDPQRLEQAATHAQEQGPGRVAALALDVMSDEAADRVRTECDHVLGPVEVLINNAGTSFNRPLAQLSDADWQSQWELHVMAPMRFMRVLAPGMVERGWGRIVNVSSASGKRPSLTNIAYSVTKAALLSLSRAFAETYAPTGVLINAVAPGLVDTELWLKDGWTRRPARHCRTNHPRASLLGTGQQRPARALRPTTGDRQRDRVLMLPTSKRCLWCRLVGRWRGRARDHLKEWTHTMP